MRRPVKHKTHIEPDTKYSSLLVAKFINKIMYSGKKAIAMKIVYGALERAEKKLNKPAMEILDQAIANAASVLDCDLDIARKPVMLQPVIADDDVAVRLHAEHPGASGCAIAPDPHRAAAAHCKQQRLVANASGVVVSKDCARSRVGAALTAAQDRRSPALPLQFRGKP